MKKLHYQFDFKRYREHLVDVTLTFTAHQNNPVVWLPVWIAGSYLVREFARHITVVTVTIQNVEQRCQKINKNHWQIVAKQGEVVHIHYEVYAYDLSVRGAYVDQTRLYGNFTALALAVQGQENQAIIAELICPIDFMAENEQAQLATALPEKMHQLSDKVIYQITADNYEHLTDSPFEIAQQDEVYFQVVNPKTQQHILHRFTLSGIHTADCERIKTDLTKICQTYVYWLGDAPFQDYLFMTMATGNDYGGLEHLSSTSLITPRQDLPSLYEPKIPNENYQRFLGLCSHEYFHAWWVKTVRPEMMLTADFNQENYTSLLWVFEGFTSYIDDFMLQASGVINQTSYLKLLTAQINRYWQTQGRALQSVAESSFDTWIKLYRADENTPNAGVSYYNKGALVALCLDLTLMQHGARLFDVIEHFYQQAKQQQNQPIGINDGKINTVLTQFLPTEIWQHFRQNYIDGTTELPLTQLLSEQGILINSCEEDILWGLKLANDPMGLKVQRVFRQSQASEAGISAHDVIIAIDGIKASEKQLKAMIKHQMITKDDVLCHIFRRDELLLLSVPPIDNHHIKHLEKWQLTIHEITKVKEWLRVQDCE